MDRTSGGSFVEYTQIELRTEREPTHVARIVFPDIYSPLLFCGIASNFTIIPTVMDGLFGVDSNLSEEQKDDVKIDSSDGFAKLYVGPNFVIKNKVTQEYFCLVGACYNLFQRHYIFKSYWNPNPIYISKSNYIEQANYVFVKKFVISIKKDE